MTDSQRPILVGAGQLTDRPVSLTEAMSPIEMMECTAGLAADDAGLAASALNQVETLIVVNSVGRQLVDNPPAALAQRIGAEHCAQFLTVTGGNTPQMLVNHWAEAIARGDTSMVLLSGAEALDSQVKAVKSGEKLDWSEGRFSEPNLFSIERPPSNDTEAAHGLALPIVMYPLFENALRHHYGASINEHQQSLGELFASFTETAARNPYSWFPTRRSAQQISEVSESNRYVGFPYTKYLNAVIRVNQSASVLLTSEAKARELGIDRDRWVYLHGCADVNDIWNVSERINFHSSPALQAGIARALDMAEITATDIHHFDIYSCFPAIVQITRDALGMAKDNPQALTVTGGLPYFGGPGNNYTMHAIATMIARLREAPGEWGLVTGNGWYVTKHSLGIYSTTRPKAEFNRQDPAILQQKIDQAEHPTLNTHPSGKGTVETYTVLFGRSGDPERGVIIGRLSDGQRFIAHTSSEPSLLSWMVDQSPIGKSGVVKHNDASNLFEFTG